MKLSFCSCRLLTPERRAILELTNRANPAALIYLRKTMRKDRRELSKPRIKPAAPIRPAVT
jgi:hypothetical protein